MFNEKLIKFMSEILLKYPDAVLKIVTSINKSIENFCIKSRIGYQCYPNPTQNQNIYLLKGCPKVLTDALHLYIWFALCVALFVVMNFSKSLKIISWPHDNPTITLMLLK